MKTSKKNLGFEIQASGFLNENLACCWRAGLNNNVTKYCRLLPRTYGTLNVDEEKQLVLPKTQGLRQKKMT
jgi:hypothetical protein